MKRRFLWVAAWVVAGGCDGDGGTCRSIDDPPPYGGLVITEIMAAPSGGGVGAEWVELRNVLPWAVDPDGLRLVSGDAEVALDCDGPVNPGGVFVAAGSANPVMNGGIQDVMCVWSGPLLPDEVQDLPANPTVAVRTNRLRIQSPDGALIDDVPFLVSGVGFPEVGPGVSIELCAEQISAAANDHGRAWHLATVAPPARFTGGDLGTPGMIGFSCGLAQAEEGGD
ncbi:MAG: hypothetical protein ABIK09_06790 [Pseudomonadota bacterium]